MPVDETAVHTYCLNGMDIHANGTDEQLAAIRSKSGRTTAMSPFRYPGGKAFLVPELTEKIQNSPQSIKYYAEPFAGGAGAAVQLLASGIVKKVILNDADRRIYSAWDAILNHNSEFKNRLLNTEVTIDNWYRLRELVVCPEKAPNDFELGFATYFLNRTNRSGILIGAGPIGGYAQSGKWKIDARYYLDTMLGRIGWIGRHSEAFELHNLDAVTFLRDFRAEKARKTFFFIDPPYVSAGARLYMNSMGANDHRKLGKALMRKQSLSNWYMTYDNDPLIREIYNVSEADTYHVKYSLQSKRDEKELRILSN